MNVEMVKEMKEEKFSYEIPEIKDLTQAEYLLGDSQGFVDGDGGEETDLDTNDPNF